MTTSLLNFLMPAACVALAASVLAVVPPNGAQDKLTAGAAREEIVALYAKWGRARVSFDEEAIERMLDPEFYVLLDGRRISREEFVNDDSSQEPGPATHSVRRRCPDGPTGW